MVYYSQLEDYDKCSKIPNKSIDIKASHFKIQRVTEIYWKELGKTKTNSRISSTAPSQEVLYEQTNCSMLFTRDDDWKEVKVGRLIKSNDCIDSDGKIVE